MRRGIVFLIFATLWFRIQTIGTLQIFEPVVAVWGLWLLLFSYKRMVAIERRLLLLGTVWLVAQGGVDIVLNTTMDKSLRGGANIFFYVVMQFTLTRTILQRPKLIACISFGIGLGMLMAVVSNPTEIQEMDPWKFGAGMATCLITLTSLGYFKVNNYVGLFSLMAMSALSLALGTRGLAGILALTGVLALLSDRLGKRGEISISRGLAYGVAIVVAVSITMFVYNAMIDKGIFSKDVQEKFEGQRSSNLGFLLSGRSEVLASIPAIIDAPLIGHGSWAEDKKYSDILVKRIEEIDNKELSTGEESYLIPTHSHLFGAWVQAGLAGGIYWLYVIFIILKAQLQLPRTEHRYRLLIQFVLLAQAWDVLFSPLGIGARLTSALGVSIAVYIAQGKHEEAARGGQLPRFFVLKNRNLR